MPEERLPEGLCGNREDHEPHVHESATLGRFWCSADQSKRLPYAAERRRRDGQGQGPAEVPGDA